jgi:cytochrome P450
VAEPLVANFPVQRTCPFATPEVYEELREQAPAVKVNLPEGEAWALTRHEDVRALLVDPRFSSNRADPGFPTFAPGQRELAKAFPFSIISMDAPVHGEKRREVVGEFTVKRMRALQPRIQQIVDELLDDLLAGPNPTDLVAAFSLPVPSLVICELLGVPYADHDFFQTRTTALIRRTTPVDERTRARDELRQFLDDLVSAKEAEPTDDVLGRQVLRQRESGGVDHDALVALAVLLLLAGHETTANMISLGTMTLLSHPDALAALRADPAKTPAAIEELLRYFTIAEFATSRVATEDVELAGVTIRKGEGVLGLSHAANRDPEVFTDPATLDIERGARNHVAFGFGAHQCLGQNLARMELQIVFDTLLRRIPTLQLATSVDDLPFKDDANIYGLYELPVTW